MKVLVLSFTLLITLPGLAQPGMPDRASGNKTSLSGELVAAGQRKNLAAFLDQSSVLSVPLADDDTLLAKRGFLSTSIYKNGRSLSRSDIITSFQPVPESISKYRWGTALNPIGPIVALSGLALGYVGIKGESTTATIRGVRTQLNAAVPDVQVTYINRSLPKLLGGLGLVIGGICLIELSNELIAKSVHVYNTSLNQPRKVTFIRRATLGLTPDGSLGLRAWF